MGKGLPYSGNWLNLGINEEPVTAEFRPVPDPEPLYDNVWEFDLPPFDKEGKQEIEVFAIVNHEKIHCVQTAEVAASAEQLWQKGLYAQALIKKPDENWLKTLDRRAEKEPAFEEECLKILAQVRKEHPENKEINLRYWPLLHKIETSRHSDDISRYSVEKRNPEQSAGLDSGFRRNDGKKIGKWLATALCLILLFAGGMFLHSQDWFMPNGETGRTAEEERIKKEKERIAEAERIKKENERIAEEKRIKAEQERIAEEERIKKENERIAAEKQLKDEQDRIAEAKRKKDEEDRLKAEAERKKKEEERLKAEAEQQQKRTDAENQYAEIVKTVNSGKWDEAKSMISQKRDLLKTWLDSEKYGHMTDLETFFGNVTDAEKLRAKSSFDTPEDFAPALSLYEKAKQTAVKLPAEIKLIARIQGKMKELTDKRDELLAKIQKEKAEEIYANIIRSVKNGNRKTAENAISGNTNLLSTYLDKSKAGHIRNLEKFWQYLDEGDGLAGKRPETEKNLKAAADAYSNAETSTKNLSGIVSLGDGIAEKRQKVLARRDKLMQEAQDSGTVAGKTVKAKDGRFISYTDGTVYDTKMNLTWAAEDNGSDVTWQQAEKYCRTYKGGGWRMPTQDELFSLVGKKNGVTKDFDCWRNDGYDDDNYIVTALIHLTCSWVWALENDGSSGARVVFGNGFRNVYNMDGFLLSRALPVRSGK